MGYLYLFAAIITEVVATSALKNSNGFTAFIPSAIVVIGYGASFCFLSLVLRTIPVGIAYAIWAGMGIFLITLVGAIMFKEHPTIPTIIGMVLILSGVVVVHLSSGIASH